MNHYLQKGRINSYLWLLRKLIKMEKEELTLNVAKEMMAEYRYEIKCLKEERHQLQTHREFLLAVRKDEQSHQGWVEVSDRLPEIPPVYYDKENECWAEPCTINVIVYDRVEDIVYEKSFGITEWDKDITHWMYLPDKPEKI
jgi:hypothetical protein